MKLNKNYPFQFLTRETRNPSIERLITSFKFPYKRMEDIPKNEKILWGEAICKACGLNSVEGNGDFIDTLLNTFIQLPNCFDLLGDTFHPVTTIEQMEMVAEICLQMNVFVGNGFDWDFKSIIKYPIKDSIWFFNEWKTFHRIPYSKEIDNLQVNNIPTIVCINDGVSKGFQRFYSEKPDGELVLFAERQIGVAIDEVAAIGGDFKYSDECNKTFKMIAMAQFSELLFNI